MATLSLPILRPEAYDNTIVKSHMECPRRALYEYVLNRRIGLGDDKNGISQNPALGWGQIYHRYREKLQQGARKDLPLANLHPQLVQQAISLWHEPPEDSRRGWMTFERLRDTLDTAYQYVLDELAVGTMKVVETEMPYALSLPTGERHSGRIDQLVEWRDRLWVRDFKTTSWYGPSYWNGYEVDHQMTGYWWAAGELSGRTIAGVIVEVMYNNKTKGPEIHSQSFGRNKSHFKAWVSSLSGEIGDFERNLDRLDELGIYAFPQRTTACGNWGGCGYLPACELGGQVAIEDWLEQNTVESRWSPLEGIEEG